MKDPERQLPATRRHRGRLWPEAAIVALGLAIFGQVIGFGFVNFDDPQLVTENPFVRSGLSVPSLRWATTAVVGGNWIPATWFSHLLDVELFGLRAGGHHLINLLLHLVNALLLLRLLAGITGNRAGSILAALIFAVHPLNVESVAWVAQRRTLLMTLFGLLAARGWVRYLRRPGAGRYLLALLLFVIGLLAKPLLVTFPLLLLLLDAWPFGRLQNTARRGPAPPGLGAAARPKPAWFLLLEKAPFLALAGVVGLIALRTQAGAMTLLPPTGLGQRISHVLVSDLWYFGKTVWPSGLAVFYPYPRDGDPAPRVIAAAAVLLCASAVALGQRRRLPGLAVGWAWFIVSLLPVSGILQVGEQAYADRYAYLPLVGLLAGLAGSFPETALRRARGGPAAVAAVCCAVLALGASSFAQARHWRDGRTLFTRALAVTAGNYMAHNNLASLMFNAGELDGAARHFSETIRHSPRPNVAYRNLGLVRLEQGDFAAALEAFRSAVRARPADARGHRDLGRSLESLGHPQAALEVYREALRHSPGDPVTRKLVEGLSGDAARPRNTAPP